MAFPSTYKYGFLIEIQALFLDVIKYALVRTLIF